MAEPLRKIPESVLALLRHQWKVPEPGYSSFESVFNDEDDPERRANPSYYLIRKGREVEWDDDALSHKEAVALVNEGALGSLAEDHGSHVGINEHAQHALIDFCQEVYGAWAKYRTRVKEVERVPVLNRD